MIRPLSTSFDVSMWSEGEVATWVDASGNTYTLSAGGVMTNVTTGDVYTVGADNIWRNEANPAMEHEAPTVDLSAYGITQENVDKYGWSVISGVLINIFIV